VIAAIGALGVAGAAQAQLSHFPDAIFHDSLEGASAGPFNDADASRFLAQATFGPTDADIAHLRAVGYQGWLTEQFNATPTYEITDLPGQPNSAYLNWIQSVLHEQIGQNNRQEAWFLGALGGPDPKNNTLIHSDQLRQRVAFALSEIFVVSDQNALLSGFPQGMAWYYDILIRDAFGNYRNLLQDVTLSPAMGVYLNMMGNQRADAAQNLHPDENYAREINQLFSIGLVMLNADGTPQLDAGGNPIPTYTQGMITNFAHVFTGFTWYDCDENTNPGDFPYCGPDYGGSGQPPFADNFMHPMVGFASYHDNGTGPDDISQKQLLSYTNAANGGVLADGGTPDSDVGFALDNIANHPNVAPFIGKQLIMRLVTSNPSPAYVARIAKTFNDNRNDPNQLWDVVQAILLDPEARYGQFWNPATFGKLREPLLTETHFWRAMHAVHACGQNVAANGNSAATDYANQPYRFGGYSTAWATDDTQYGDGIAQASLDAFTVFNFFKPSYMPAGEMSADNLLGPEFQLQTDSIIANTSNSVAYRSFNLDSNDPCDANDTFGDVKINHAQDLALAGSGSGGPSDPADRLVDEYNKRFMSGQMSPYMRNQLLSYLNTIDSNWANNGEDWRLERIYRALYLILSSPEYMIQK
jgi:uncharacterized protein (DUF1800 family)